MLTRAISTIFIVFSVMHCCVSISLPSYISPCSRSDPRLDECMVKNANKAIPYVLKGDAKFNIPSLLPLKVPAISVESSSDLRIDFKNCELNGLNTAIVRRMHVDFERRHVSIDVHVADLNVIADYEIDGRILILPVRGAGPANVTIDDGIYTYDFTYDLVQRRSGRMHVKFLTHSLEYKAKRIYLQLENLFNGDKVLGANMNRFLDENWKAVTDDLYPSLKAAVGAIVTSIAKKLFSKVPFEEIFLP